MNAGGTEIMPAEHHPGRTRPHVLILLWVLAPLFAIGCQSTNKLKTKAYNTVRSTITSTYHDPEAETKMTQAEALMAEGKYQEAGKIFGDLADNTNNPVLLAEKARHLEADCLRMRKKNSEAVATYHRQLMDFPAGAYREQACTKMYEIAYGWLEQDTLAQIEAEQAGRKSSWWKRKSTYPNFFDDTKPTFDVEGEALRTLENVHTHDLVGPNADRALFWCGYVHFYRGRFDEADHFFSQLVEMHKDSPLRPVALEMAIMAKNNSTGGAVYDTGKAAEALQLVHHAEASEPTYNADEKKAQWLTRQKLAVRMQLAEKDFKTAEYYERTGHSPSAYFYYELVCRRYPGTKFSDLAQIRMKALEVDRAKLQAEKEKQGGSTSPIGGIKKQWDKLTGHHEVDPTVQPVTPAGPVDVPRNLPADITNPR